MASDYFKSDENEVIPRRIKCYSGAEEIIDVATENGLRCERVVLPHWEFCVLKIFSTKRQFKQAQYEWLARMIQTKAETEIEL